MSTLWSSTLTGKCTHLRLSDVEQRFFVVVRVRLGWLAGVGVHVVVDGITQLSVPTCRKNELHVHGGGGFILACKDFGVNVQPFIPCLPFFFFFWVEISSCTLIPLFMLECSLTNCMWAHFQTASHTVPEQQHSLPTPSSLGQGSMHA